MLGQRSLLLTQFDILDRNRQPRSSLLTGSTRKQLCLSFVDSHKRVLWNLLLSGAARMFDQASAREARVDESLLF